MTAQRSLPLDNRVSPAEPDGSFTSEPDHTAGGVGATRLTGPGAGTTGRRREPIRFFTVLEVAERLSVSERTVRRWIAAGAVADVVEIWMTLSPAFSGYRVMRQRQAFADPS